MGKTIILITTILCFYFNSTNAEAFSNKAKEENVYSAYWYEQDEHGNYVYQPNYNPNYYVAPEYYAPVVKGKARRPASMPPMATQAPYYAQKPRIYTPYMKKNKYYIPEARKFGHVGHGRSTASVQRRLGKVSPEEALSDLKHGNLRFTQGMSRKEGMTQADRIKLMAGQKPHTIVLSCSDSRVPPEHVFNKTLGEIFVIRTAGQALDSSVIASIELAVKKFGTRLILVMGHESCNAVTAALQTPDGHTAGSPALDSMVADIKPRLGNIHRLPASVGLIRESTDNARGVVKDLITRSAIIRKNVSNGTLQVRSALYHLDSGLVDFH